MQVWKLLIRTAPDAPDLGQGYARADTMGEALELAQHPEAIAIPSQAMWPGAPGGRVVWMNGPMARRREP